MKRMQILTACAILAILIASPAVASAQASDTCLTLIVDMWNPDSVLIDTCQTGPPSDRWYARHGFDIDFRYAVVALPASAPDAVVEIGWEDIDTTYHEIRAAFAQIEAKFGAPILRKAFPHLVDTNNLASKTFHVSFERPVRVVDALSALDSIPTAEAYFVHEPINPAGVRMPVGLNRTPTVEIRPPNVIITSSSLLRSAPALINMNGVTLGIAVPVTYFEGKYIYYIDASIVPSGTYLVIAAATATPIVFVR